MQLLMVDLIKTLISVFFTCARDLGDSVSLLMTNSTCQNILNRVEHTFFPTIKYLAVLKHFVV